MRNSNPCTYTYCNCLRYSAKSTKSLLHNIILLPCYLSIWCYADNIQIHWYPMNWFKFMASCVDFSVPDRCTNGFDLSANSQTSIFFGAWWVPKTRYYQTLLANIANMYTKKVYFFKNAREKAKICQSMHFFGLQNRTNKLLRVSLKV